MGEIDNLIKEIDNKIARLEKEMEYESKEEKKLVTSLDQTEVAMETLKEVVSKINAIEDLKTYRNNDKKSYDNMILTLVSWFYYLKREKNDSFEYQEAKDLIMSIGEKHAILYNWCKGLVEDSGFVESINVDEIKNKLRRKTVVFNTGGVKPTNELYESWIGKVGWQLPLEKQPIDESGNLMIPIATLFLEKLEYVPEALKGIKLITIFMSNEIWDNLSAFDYSNWFVIKTYESLNDVVACNYISDKIIPFPLIPKLENDDFPLLEDLEDDMLNMINELEKTENIDYYNDIVENNYHKHKLGGYPASIQGGVGYEEGFEFVLQISSDSKANFNIVDSGNFYFGYNPTTKLWSVRCDFY